MIDEFFLNITIVTILAYLIVIVYELIITIQIQNKTKLLEDYTANRLVVSSG